MYVCVIISSTAEPLIDPLLWMPLKEPYASNQSLSKGVLALGSLVSEASKGGMKVGRIKDPLYKGFRV